MADSPSAEHEIIVPGKGVRNVGKPPHVPTDQQKGLVSLGAAGGMPQADIAKAIGIDAKTLREHYREELDTGKAKANMNVLNKLYKAAMDGDIAAIIFWCKTQILSGQDPEIGDLPMVDITDASKEVLRLAIRDANAEFE